MVKIENPLLRTPLALIVDDSCPVINLTYHWIEQRQAWKAKFQPQVGFKASDGDPAQMHKVPPTIPADFARKWGEWCGEAGIKGKFSLVPYPAGIARVDQGLPGFDRHEFEAWMNVYRTLIQPNFDVTCEMLTHSHVVDLKTWQFTDAWEQYEWVDPPVEPSLELLTDYIATAMQICRDAGVSCEGVTSPGAFGSKQESAYAKATLDAALRVNGDKRPFYFLHVADPPENWPAVPIWHADKVNGRAIASIIGCTHDWFGSWTGYDAGDPDLFITEDLQGGRLPQVLARELPCVLVGHWPGFYFGGEEVGFDVLKEVKRRLDRYDPDQSKTIWMKTSEIAHYEMARQLSEISTADLGEGKRQITIETQFPTRNFTLRVEAKCQRVQVDGVDLREVYIQRDLTEGTFWAENKSTTIVIDLPMDGISIEVIAK